MHSIERMERQAAASSDGGRVKGCSSTKGRWCARWHMQEPQPFKAPPRGSKPCPKDCSGVGNCNADWGICECPAGALRQGPWLRSACC